MGRRPAFLLGRRNLCGRGGEKKGSLPAGAGKKPSSIEMAFSL